MASISGSEALNTIFNTLVTPHRLLTNHADPRAASVSQRLISTLRREWEAANALRPGFWYNPHTKRYVKLPDTQSLPQFQRMTKTLRTRSSESLNLRTPLPSFSNARMVARPVIPPTRVLRSAPPTAIQAAHAAVTQAASASHAIRLARRRAAYATRRAAEAARQVIIKQRRLTAAITLATRFRRTVFQANVARRASRNEVRRVTIKRLRERIAARSIAKFTRRHQADRKQSLYEPVSGLISQETSNGVFTAMSATNTRYYNTAGNTLANWGAEDSSSTFDEQLDAIFAYASDDIIGLANEHRISFKVQLIIRAVFLSTHEDEAAEDLLAVYKRKLYDPARAVRPIMHEQIAFSKHVAETCPEAVQPSFIAALIVHVSSSDGIIQNREALDAWLMKNYNNIQEYASNAAYQRYLAPIDVDVHVYRYTGAETNVGGSANVQLPTRYQNSNFGIVNPLCSDNRCFYYCLRAAGLPADTQNKGRISQIESKSTLPVTIPSGATFPVPLTDIEIWRAANPHIAINVYEMLEDKCEGDDDDQDINPRHAVQDLNIEKATKQRAATQIVNLLLYNHHFFLMNKLSAVVCQTDGKDVCPMCCCGFHKNGSAAQGIERMTEHMAKCKGRPEPGEKFISMPEEGSVLEFSRQQAFQRFPLIVAYDFEAVQRDLADGSRRVGEQKAKAYGACIISDEPLVSLDKIYTAKICEDAAVEFLVYLFSEVLPAFRAIKTYDISSFESQENEREYKDCTQCWMCKKPFLPGDEGKLPFRELKKPITKKATSVAQQMFFNSHNAAVEAHNANAKKYNAMLKRCDHDHYKETNNIRGAAHNECNLKCCEVRKIPVVAHNAANYDCTFILKALGTPRIQALLKEGERVWSKKAQDYVQKPYKVSTIAINYVKIKQLVVGPFVFCDSLAFMKDSLDKLVSYIDPADRHYLNLGASAFPTVDRAFELLNRKLPMPYEHNWLAEGHAKLPDDFVTGMNWSSTLKTGAIAGEEEAPPSNPYTDVAAAQAAFADLQRFFDAPSGDELIPWADAQIKIAAFECHEVKINVLKDLKEAFYKMVEKDEAVARIKGLQATCQELGVTTWDEFIHTYLRVDVLALADVVTNLRKIVYEACEMDPFHFVGLPGVGFAAALRMTGVKLDLFSKQELYERVRTANRGGYSAAGTRTCDTNLDILPGFDATKEQAVSVYFDFKNMYGRTMSMHLPTGGFVDEELNIEDPAEIDAFINDPKWGSLPKNAGQASEEFQTEDGAMVEVDIHFPEHLHDYFSEFPICPVHMAITNDMLPKDQAHNKRSQTAKKLIAQVGPLKSYQVHITALKLYTSLGAVVTKIHCALHFKQSPWLRPYVEEMSKRRADSKTKFGKQFYKLFVNSVYGQFNEDVMKHLSTRFHDRASMLQARINSPNFIAFRQFCPTMCMSFSNKDEYVLNKPVTCAFAILDLAKVHIYSFWYKCIKPAFPDVTLLGTDTDSLKMRLPCKGSEDYFTRMREISEPWFDFSSFPKTHPLYSPANAGRIGYMNDEYPAIWLAHTTNLRAKCYNDVVSDHHSDAELKVAEKPRSKVVCKGAPKSAAEKLTRAHFHRALAGEPISVIFHSLRANTKNEMFLERNQRVALVKYDDKAYLLPCGLKRLPFGHYKIADYKAMEE